jgi:heme exporter protein A
LFEGRPIRSARREARRALGFTSHQPLLYRGLTPLENLTLFGRLGGVGEPARRASEMLDRLQMTAFARKPVERFSRGMLQRIALARVFLNEPRVLVLDEPYTGLDDEGTGVLNAMILEAQARGAATLVISHDRERLGALMTRHCVMEDGVVS